MPRSKRREESDNAGINRYLCKQDGESGEESGLEKQEVSLNSLEGFLMEEFQKLNFDLKVICQTFRDLDTCLSSIE